MCKAAITIDTLRTACPIFFAKGAMDFFNTLLESPAIPTRNGNEAFFVTSEQYDGAMPRLFTVRRFTAATERLRTAGSFQAHATKLIAMAAARKLAEEVG